MIRWQDDKGSANEVLSSTEYQMRRPCLCHPVSRRASSRHPLTRALQRFDEYLRAPSTPLVALQAWWWKIGGCAELKAAFLHKIVDGLSGKTEEFPCPGGARLLFGIVHEFGTDALILIGGIDADTGQFGLSFCRIGMDGDAG